jgi:hypothetical protein
MIQGVAGPRSAAKPSKQAEAYSRISFLAMLWDRIKVRPARRAIADGDIQKPAML